MVGLALVILTVASLASSTGVCGVRTSWKGSSLTLQIPKNFPVDKPLVRLAVLTPQHPSWASVSDGEDEESTLAELRMPHDNDDVDMGRVGRPWQNKGNRGGGSPGKHSSRLVILRNPRNAFQTNLYDDESTVSLRLSRELQLEDYVRHGAKDRLIRVNIGPNVTQIDPECYNYNKRGGGEYNTYDSGDESLLDNGVLNITIIVGDSFNCDKPKKEQACFLPDGEIQLRQWENRDVTPLLEMPSFIDFCPGMVAFYSITMPGVENGRQELQTDSDRLIVRPTAPLDRELRGDSLPFTIKCTLRAGKRRLLAPQIKEAMLTVIDEDDSAPIRSRNPIVDWHYNNKSDDLDDQLLVLDPDLTDTNNYMVELIGNIYNLVTIESVTEFGIRSELCMKEAENVTAYNFNAFCTLIAPVVKFKETGLHAKLPPKIHFSVVFIDRNLLPSIAQEKKQVKYSVTLTLPNYEEEVKPTPLHALTHNTDNGVLSPETIALLKELPPSELNITIIPPVNQYYRLGQLIYPNVTQLHFNSYLPANAAFILTSDSVNVSIKVTPITGILYVSDPDGLRSGEFTIVRGDSVTLVTLTVVEQVNFPCSSQNPEEVTPWCASIRYSSECQETCGLGAAGTCSWRPLETEKGKTQYTKYATCSPALDTCPNNICDELEYTFTGICPQDCMYGKKKTNNHMTIGPRGRGIQAGLGVCTCDDYACQCFPDYQTRPSPSPGVEPPLKEPAPASSLACGRGCKVGISVAAVVFLGFTLLSVVFCRRHASGNGKQKGGVISLGTLANEERSSSVPYNTRDETHDSLIHGIRASPRPDHNLVPALNLTLCSQIDRKWEFPRSRLVIEQTLGEGEFGKVMKARAQGIGGNLGYTTVAVKMLKSNSTQVELSDLLSEYTLLKEVSHPNVVRLLGACTGKGGPVYIIIEYCQYGSLRNYLKRSRHAEFENRVGSGPTEIAAGDYAITPKDLLSFAWQICKGMAYLTDMKLVHRDLAARNVLLAAGKVCKISDFGLTRDVYEGDLYFKRSKGRVPVKWMALESLVDHVYTSKSDVWGFGVLLWELVTLGTPPYPGVTPERLFSLLKAGYRMEKPDNCSQELYDVMLQCWAEDPARRPCFQELTDIFDAMIQADVEYLELRSLIVTNRGYFDGVPEPSQQFLEAPPQFQDSPQPPVGPINEEREASTQGSTHQGAPPQLNIDETQLPIQQDWSPPGSEQLDSDSYLVARTDLGAPRRAESTEPLLAPTSPPVTAAHTPTITTSHAHNPAYSPTSEIPHPTPLHYSTLASRPDEEDAHNLECCRSEEDSDSGRATGDSGYATEEGRGRWRAEHKGGSRPPQASPRGSSYSPVPHHDQDDDDDQDPEGDHDDDQDTSEDLEERQELLTEDLLGHLTPSPEPAQTAHTTAHTHNAAHATTHTTPVIV